MVQKVTAMDIRTATALVGQVDNVAAFCRSQQISRQTFTSGGRSGVLCWRLARDPEMSRKTAVRPMREYAELATGATLPEIT
jgi:hypothetical protein